MPYQLVREPVYAFECDVCGETATAVGQPFVKDWTEIPIDGSRYMLCPRCVTGFVVEYAGGVQGSRWRLVPRWSPCADREDGT